jgi:16S rRNA processing protein RimM
MEAQRTPADERTPFIVAGRLVSAFGIRGQVACVATRVGEDAIVPGAGLFIGADAADRAELMVVSARRARGRIVLAFEGVTTVEQAERLVGESAYVSRAAVHLAEGEYLDDDLIGLQMVDESGEALGVVASVKHFPAQDCLVVRPGDALVPLVREFIRAVDVPGRTIVVRLPLGVLDDSLAERA